MTVNALSAATIAIYIILIQPTLYCVYRHGWPGFLGWFYLQLFCLIRIIGNGISIHTSDTASPIGPSSSKSVLIVNNIGLSPLLLAAAGILHEARRARTAPRAQNSKLEWGLVIHYHFLVSGALGLIVAGVVFLESGNLSDINTASALMKAGAAVVIICWLLLVTWTVVSLIGRSATYNQAALDHANGSKLLYAVMIALPLIAMRLIYGVASLMLEVNGHTSSKFLTSLAVKVILSTVPEMVLTIVFILAGIATRDIAGSFWSKHHAPRGDIGMVKGQVGPAV